MNSETVFENLEQHLNSLTNREQYKSRTQMDGLFYAIALTPFRITAMEVLPLSLPMTVEPFHKLPEAT